MSNAFSYSLSNPSAMLCRKSGSTWLDRLRTAKGFPVDTAGLDNFLHNPNSPPLETPTPQPNSVSIRAPPQNEDKQLLTIMSDVLNELFNFGDKCSNSTKLKKSARKQTNPKIFAFSGNGSRDKGDADTGKVELLRGDDSNSGVEKVLDRWEAEEEGVGREANLVGFSRTEVTVIDTSYESWKFEKLLYRKKNVWKVRDKKGKSESVGGKKKRKMSEGVEEGHQHGGKKWKVDKKDGVGEQCALPPLNEVYYQTNASDVHDKHSNKVVGTNKKNQSLTLENGSSSVFLIKSIHAGKKNKASISKSFPKFKQKKI